MTSRAEVSAVVPWTRATVALLGKKRTMRSRQQGTTDVAEVGNVDAFVAAYRAHPEHLVILAANRAHHRDLRRILKRAVDARLGRKVGLTIRGHEIGSARDSLSPREREILDLVVQGSTNREMATALFITEKTVKVHLRHVYEKLGVRSRTEAGCERLRMMPVLSSVDGDDVIFSHAITRAFPPAERKVLPVARRYSSPAPARTASKAATTVVSNCVSTPCASRIRATRLGMASRYGRSDVIALYASATLMMREIRGMSSPPQPSG